MYQFCKFDWCQGWGRGMGGPVSAKLRSPGCVVPSRILFSHGNGCHPARALWEAANQPTFPTDPLSSSTFTLMYQPGWGTCGVSIHGLCQLRPSHAFLRHIWASIHSLILYCLFCFWRHPRHCNLQENVFDLLSGLKPPPRCVQSLWALP